MRCRSACRAAPLAGAVVLLTGCAGAQSSLDLRGPAAAEIAGLWWLMAALGTIVFVIVVGLLALALWRPRRTPPPAPSQPADGLRWVVIGGALLPALVIVVVFLFTVRSLGVLAGPAAPAALKIEVIGHDWWWEVRYPQSGFVTANEIHIPVGQPVELTLTSVDVIHSFWVPQLHGKMDLIPGQTTTLWLQADVPGEYRGQCAEFCGVQHAKMAFLVIADPPEAFAAWRDGQRRPAREPTTPLAQQGRQVFLGSSCVQCHAIAGTTATGALGPDLTHLASRRTLAAATLPNTRGNLGGWIVNAQALKPGNHMPPSSLSPADLQALLAYLESLE